MLYHSNSFGQDSEIKKAFIKCLVLALASIKQMKICVGKKDNLTGGVIEKGLGEKFTKALLKKDFFFEGVTIKLETKSKINYDQMVILALHINPKYLEELIDKNGDSDVVYIAWTQKELDQYLKKYTNSIAI